MTEATLERRVWTLERRVARVESQLGIAPALAPAPVSSLRRTAGLVEPIRLAGPAASDDAVPAPSRRASEPPPLPPSVAAQAAAAPFPAYPEAAPSASARLAAEDTPADVASSREAPVWPPVPPPAPQPVLPYAARAARQPVAQTGLEQAIGLKWAGWVGAIVLVIGAGLGIKFAYDNGWFNVISPSLRLALMSLAGFALIGAGEWVFRKVNTLSAVGLFGSGVAVLFLVSFAGHRFYGLYARETAYVLMGLSTLIGAAVAVRGNLVSIAVLSLLGGNLAPIVLHGNATLLVPFLAYLMMLQVVALFLAWWGREPKWWTLRGLSLATTSLWLFGILLTRSTDEWTAGPFAFVLIFAALYHVELIATALAMPAGDTQPEKRGGYRFAETDLTSPGVLFGALVTAGVVAATLFIFRDSTDITRGMFVLGFGAVCALVGLLLPVGRRPQLNAMSTGYRIQAAILLIVAVPVGLGGASIEIGWALLAVGFAVMAMALDLRISRFAALATWGLAVGHVAIRSVEADHPASGAWLTLFGHGVPEYGVIGWGLALLGHAIAFLISRPDRAHGAADPLMARDRTATGQVASAAATIVWIGISLAALPPVGATLSLVLYAWLLVAGDFAAERLGLAVQSVVVLSLATAKWAIVDTLAERLSDGWSAAKYAPVFNPVMGMGVLIAISLAALCWLRRRSLVATIQRWAGGQASERDAVLLIAALVTLLVAAGLSFEIDRAVERAELARSIRIFPYGQVKHLAWTMLWMTAFCAFFGLVQWVEPSRQRRLLWLRQAWALPMFLAGKFLAIDLLWYRITHGPAPATVLLNLQALAAAVVVGGLVMVRFTVDSSEEQSPNSPDHSFARAAAGMIVLTLLFAGSLEIDRYFEVAARSRMIPSDARLAKQVALSIYWALFAVGSVIAGFRVRAASVRYFGLALFGLTILKVFFVDLSSISGGYRVLSFLGLGLLLLGTSVLYGKLSPKLLGNAEVPQP